MNAEVGRGIYPSQRGMVKGKKMSILPCIDNAFLFIKDGKISAFGKMAEIKTLTGFKTLSGVFQIDAKGKLVFPCWCDSHTHLVFAAGRENEFVDRIRGLSYEEIGKRGGGIINSAKKLNQSTEDSLMEGAFVRLKEIIETGTGAVEIKSGYGLSAEGELKMLRVIKKLKSLSPVTIKTTFLGAHALPEKYRNDKSGYIKLIIEKMLPAIAGEGLADYIDVFCEKNYFSASETGKILDAGARIGLKPKIHVNQFNIVGGVPAAVKRNAISVDHLEHINDADIKSIKSSRTIATLLPGCSFFLGIPYAPARMLIDAGLPVALASDFNPGSSPAGNMNFIVALACIKMKMIPEEAINAATINGAAAMELSGELGSIAIGKKANVFITKPMSSIASLPYYFGSNLIESVILNGKIL